MIFRMILSTNATGCSAGFHRATRRCVHVQQWEIQERGGLAVVARGMPDRSRSFAEEKLHA